MSCFSESVILLKDRLSCVLEPTLGVQSGLKTAFHHVGRILETRAKIRRHNGFFGHDLVAGLSSRHKRVVTSCALQARLNRAAVFQDGPAL